MMNKKQQLGFIGSWAFIILMLCLSIGFYIAEQYRKDEAVKHLRDNAPALTADQVKLLDDYKVKSSPATAINGMFRGEIKGDGDTVHVSYYFGRDKSLTKSLEARDISLKGTAKYTFQGAVLTYTGIEGDKGLFSPQGEAVTVEGDKLIFPGIKYPFELEKDPN